jgi:hypothetical protein
MDDKDYAGKRFLTPVQALRCLVYEDDIYNDDSGVHVTRCGLQNVQSSTKCSCHEIYRNLKHLSVHDCSKHYHHNISVL